MANPYINGLPLSASYTARTMMPEFRAAAVYMSNPKLAVITQLTDMFSDMPERATNVKVVRSIIGNTTVSMDINTRTAVGATLVLTSADPTFLTVRVDDFVQSTATKRQAFVTAVSPGSVTIVAADGAAWSGSDYAAGGYLSVLGNVVTGENSLARTSLNIVPTQIENYISTSRSTSTISRRAAGIETYERWHGKFWSWAQEATMKTTFAREYENKLLTGVAVNGGISGKSVSRGMIPYAKTYGQYYPTASGTVTTATLNNIIEMLKSNTQSFTTEYACLVGIRAMRDIQENVFTNFLTTAGTNTILGGTLGKGIDFYQWNAQGITLKFIPYPLFDDAELWKGDISAVTGRLKTSSSILCLPMGKVQTTEGQVMPFKKWYLGKQEFIYTYHPGTVGVNGEPLNGAFDQGYQISVNDTDAISCQILTDSCTELVCSDNILYYELTA